MIKVRCIGVAVAAVALTAAACTSPSHRVTPPRPRLTPTVSPTTLAGTVTVTGQLMTKHGRGPVVIGTGPDPGTVTVTGAASASVTATDATLGYAVHLAPGTYTLTGHVRDGYCTPVTITIGSASSSIADDLSCVDGVSTD